MAWHSSSIVRAAKKRIPFLMKYIGRYFRCPQCRCRYYVPVPVSGSETSHSNVERSRPIEPATIDDVLRNSQEGQGAILRAFREQQHETAKLVRVLHRARWLLVAFVAVSVAELAVLLGMFAGR